MGNQAMLARLDRDQVDGDVPALPRLHLADIPGDQACRLLELSAVVGLVELGGARSNLQGDAYLFAAAPEQEQIKHLALAR